MLCRAGTGGRSRARDVNELLRFMTRNAKQTLPLEVPPPSGATTCSSSGRAAASASATPAEQTRTPERLSQRSARLVREIRRILHRLRGTTESPSPALIRPCGRFPWPIPGRGRGNLEPCGLLFWSLRLCLTKPAKPVPSSSCVRPEPWRHGVLSAPCSVHHSRSSDGWAFATHASDQRPLCQLGRPKPRGTTECRCLRNQSSGIEVPADGHTAEAAAPGCPRCASAPPPPPVQRTRTTRIPAGAGRITNRNSGQTCPIPGECVGFPPSTERVGNRRITRGH